MSFTKIKPSGWALNEKLTSAQMNQLDIDHANAIDKTGDTIASGNTIAWSNGSVLQLQSGSSVNWQSGSVFTMTSAIGTLTSSVINLNTSSQINILGNSSINVNASQLNFITSGGAHFQTGTSCLFDAGSLLTVNATSTLFNSALSSAIGSTWTLNGPVTAANLTISSTNRLKVASRSITRTFGNGITSFTGSTPYFSVASGKFFQNSILSGCQINFELTRLPHNSELNSISITYLPSSGHGSLPSGMPNFTLHRLTVATGDLLTLATGSDLAATPAIYETTRTITASGLSWIIDRTQYRYILQFFGESSTNSQTGLQVFGGKTISTITEYDEG